MKNNVVNEQRYFAGGDEGWIDLNRDFGLPENPSYLSCDGSINAFTPEYFPYDAENIHSYGHFSQEIVCGQSPPQQSQTLFAPTHQTWPSMLTNTTLSLAPQISIHSSSVPTMREREPKRGGSSFSRRTLTDNDRKRMCQYHEDHPSKKQAEIGALFGVERSTVSKILRQRDKYLSPDNRSSSPLKRMKGKFPDIERALSIWIRNLQKKEDYRLTDAIIREKAESFAATVGYKESFVMRINSNSWLEKFKERNGIEDLNLAKLNSDSDQKPTSPSGSTDSGSSSQPSNIISPVSQYDTLSPSSSRAQVVGEDEASEINHLVRYMEIESHSKSISKSDLSTTRSSISHDCLLDSSTSISSEHPQESSQTRKLQRIRSQTFPGLEINTTSLRSQPVENRDHSSSGTHLVISPSSIKRTSIQTADIAISSLPFTAKEGSIDLLSSELPVKVDQLPSSSLSAPSLPTRHDARKALETLVTFYSQAPNGDLIDQDEYLTVINLIEKMRFVSDEQ